MPLGPPVRLLHLDLMCHGYEAMSKGMTLAELLALPLMVDVSTTAPALGLSRSTGYELARRGDFPCRCYTSAAPTASLPPSCFASSALISLSYRRGSRLPRTNPEKENFK